MIATVGSSIVATTGHPFTVASPWLGIMILIGLVALVVALGWLIVVVVDAWRNS
jgi:hypothetical protein